MSSNYYAADFDPWVTNIRGLGSALAQLPAMRARAAEQQQRANLLQAQTETEGAQAQNYRASAGKLDAETTDIKGETQSGDRLSVALKKVATDPNDTNAAGDAISEFGHYFKKNPEQAAKGMGDLLSHFMAMRGDTNFAAQGSLQGNAASIANNEANNSRAIDVNKANNTRAVDVNKANNDRIMATPMNVPDNNMVIDKRTGIPISAGLQRLSPGQKLFADDDYQLGLNPKPIGEGAPLPPKTPLGTAIRMRSAAQAAADDVKNGTTNAPVILKRIDDLIGAPDAAAPKNAPATEAPATVDQPANDGKARPMSQAQFLDAPRDPKTRVVGQKYQTPKGVLKWTGTGWIAP